MTRSSTRTVHPTSAPRRSPASSDRRFLRRRLTVLGSLVVALFLLTVVVGGTWAEAELAETVAGHVVVQPGDTLWDIAVATAPDGVDPRDQVARLRALNHLDGAHLDAWAVVLLPAR